MLSSLARRSALRFTCRSRILSPKLIKESSVLVKPDTLIGVLAIVRVSGIFQNPAELRNFGTMTNNNDKKKFERLPNTVTPLNYDLTFVPNWKDHTFTGTTVVDLEVD
jgi:hypothetical protein